MKKKRVCVCVLLVFIFVISTNVMNINAMNTGFKINSLPDEEKNLFIHNINLLSINEEPSKSSIMCFDVNNGLSIAIGQNTFDRKIICIYSNKGVFQSGYTFNCSGDFGVEWDEEKLNIYFVRSGVIVSVSPGGEILEVFEVRDSIENNSYVNDYIYATKKTVGDNEYYISNNMGMLNVFATSYSQVIEKNVTGDECVIYDVSSTLFSKMILTIVFVCIIVTIVIITIVSSFIGAKQRKDSLGFSTKA